MLWLKGKAKILGARRAASALLFCAAALALALFPEGAAGGALPGAAPAQIDQEIRITDYADPEFCRQRGGTVETDGNNREVCSDVDANDTFCIIGSAERFPLPGPFKACGAVQRRLPPPRPQSVFLRAEVRTTNPRLHLSGSRAGQEMRAACHGGGGCSVHSGGDDLRGGRVRQRGGDGGGAGGLHIKLRPPPASGGNFRRFPLIRRLCHTDAPAGTAVACHFAADRGDCLRNLHPGSVADAGRGFYPGCRAAAECFCHDPGGGAAGGGDF